uniref:ABC transporter domain-containing protein n=1 Tax=Caenorhabditis tropicalis TaxID=1561998 RepID=A0A1I7TCA8_9PELO
MFNKLLHLLQKDLLLVRRSRLWTTFEILLPVILIATPPILLNMLMEDAEKSDWQGKNLNKSCEIKFDKMVFDICNGTGSRGLNTTVRDFYLDSPIEWINETIVLKNEQMSREDLMKNAKKCDNIYILESNLSSTIVISPPKRKYFPRKYSFIGHSYLWNRRVYELIQKHRELNLSRILMNQSNSSSKVKHMDFKIYCLPKGNNSMFEKSIFSYFPLFFGICSLMPVISVIRNIMLEKDTVKPYLNTIGLPFWLFYIEHFSFGVIKISILITVSTSVWVLLTPDFPMLVLLGTFFYTFNSVAFAIFFSAIFPSPKRVVEGMVLIWISTVVLTVFYSNPTPTEKWILSFLPTTAFKNYLGAVLLNTNKDSGHLSVLVHTNIMDSQPAAVYLGFMIFNTIWMLVAAIFMDKLIAFLTHVILKKIWGIIGNWNGKSSSSSSSIKTQSVGEQSTILNVQEKLDGRGEAVADIELTGLVKIYANGEKAVNGLSLRAVRGQVSILLGHNGCGKSTTFGMITGMHKPTEGKVMIGGIDANSNRSEARELIGYCPQYNPLYDKLTVMEHLRLVNALKGGSGSEFKEEAESLLKQIELTDKKDTLAKNLSGGMKRKLCVCMAMIGKSRVILLDEPTAGMDPAARIDVQNMLSLVKKDRTILLTTHYMDEAEKLGDWVFVMSHGKMAASGSIHFLKQKYGGGMLLTLVFKTSSDPKNSYEAAIKVCKAICPSATVKDERGQMMEISIPETEKPELPTLFKALEAILEHNYSSPDIQILGSDAQNQARKLELVTIGVSMSSLEQVFIKIGDECDAAIERESGSNRKLERKKKFSELMNHKNQPVEEGSSRILETVIALLEKRAYYLYRNPSQILLQIILPLATLWYFAYMSIPFTGKPHLDQPFHFESLDISEYYQSNVVVQIEDNSDTRLLEYLNSFPNLNVMKGDYNLEIEEVVKEYNMGFKTLGFVIRVSKTGKTVIHVDEENDFGSPSKDIGILMNLVASCMYLMTDLFPKLPHISSNIYWLSTEFQSPGKNVERYFLILIVLSIVIAGILIQSIVYLIEERLCKFAHQQYLTGLSTITYWAVVLLWDFILYTIIIFYIMICVFGFGVYAGHQHELIIVFYSFFFYLAPFVYLTSNVINSPTKGSFLLYIFCIFSYFSILVAVLVFSYNKKGKWFLRIMGPSVGFYVPLLKIIGMSHRNTDLKQFVDMRLRGWEKEGIEIDIISSFFCTSLLTFLLYCVTTKAVRSAYFSFTHPKSKPMPRKHYKGIEQCEAVAEEEELISTVDKEEKALVIDGLIKDFGKFRAVNGLSVSVGNEECFGMLGANGAGKTTTFDIITGLTLPTGGNVTIGGKDITETIHIGYCPQFDAMLQQISCRRTLRIMAKLQGYPNITEVVEAVLECVGMKEHGYKLIKNCSGGQKRKISVGIALMSRANCIILDEPTAGIDPRARREIWDIIHEMREQGKCSIVLTSHSMEECEALCNRIGILRKGEMIASGTSQSLKSQYGNTYMMTLILYNMNDRSTVCQKVKQFMPNAVLKTPETSLTTSFVWEIPKTKTDKWSQKYQEVAILAGKIKVKDYMLIQASLEDTFIRLITSEEKT